MIKKLALAVMLSSTALSAFAVEDAGKDFYAQLNTGYAFGMDSNKSNTDSNFKKTGKSFDVGLEAGAKVNEYFRLGLSFNYMPKFSAKGLSFKGINTATIDNVGSVKITSMSAMLNAFIDAGDFNGFKPYLVVGAGVAKNKTKNTSFTDSAGVSQTINGDSKTNFAYKVGLGTKYAINEDFDIDVRYQYVDLGKFQTKKTTSNGVAYSAATGKLRANEVMVGVAYKF